MKHGLPSKKTTTACLPHRRSHRRRRRPRPRRCRLTWRNLDSTREHNFNYRSWSHCLRTRRQESSRKLALSRRLKFSAPRRGTRLFGREVWRSTLGKHKGDVSRNTILMAEKERERREEKRATLSPKVGIARDVDALV